MLSQITTCTTKMIAFKAQKVDGTLLATKARMRKPRKGAHFHLHSETDTDIPPAANKSSDYNDVFTVHQMSKNKLVFRVSHTVTVSITMCKNPLDPDTVGCPRKLQ
jgi:hypothetical protein